MNCAHRRLAFPAAALLVLAAAPALAQRPSSPEQRILILEQQLAASQASAIRLEQRLNTIERQLQQLINQGEVGGHRIGQLEAEIARIRSDVDARLTAIESRPAPVQGEPAPAEAARAEPTPNRSADSSPAEIPARSSGPAQTAASDPGEDAYSEGFRLWRDGRYDQAITALRAFTSAFPRHPRVSFANNLIGRALLDAGQPRPAAEALLANYRSNPRGERAPDSLYYLGQALMKLGQPSQACKAYAELEDIYGASLRADLRSLVARGKSDSNC